MRKFADIIERIEYIREFLKIGKSRFAADMGMKPQTYRNYLGLQGSKPNIEIIHGIVTRYKVNPGWLLNGIGQVFTGQPADSDVPAGWESLGLQVAEDHEGPLARQHLESRDEMQNELKTLEPILRDMELPIKGLENSQAPLLNGLRKILGPYIELDPVGATREIKIFLQRLALRLEKIK